MRASINYHRIRLYLDSVCRGKCSPGLPSANAAVIKPTLLQLTRGRGPQQLDIFELKIQFLKSMYYVHCCESFVVVTLVTHARRMSNVEWVEPRKNTIFVGTRPDGEGDCRNMCAGLGARRESGDARFDCDLWRGPYCTCSD